MGASGRTFLLAGLALAASASAGAGEMYPWRGHAAPLDFVFGNEIDGHQQTRREPDGSLWGFLYVRRTGTRTADGYEVATHADCAATQDCVVGWMLQGRPAHATFSHHPPHDHPVFTVDRADIPQPGSYSHFHWLGQAMPQPALPAAGYFLQLTATARFCFIHHGAEAATSASDCRANGGVAIERGLDVASHLNLLAGPAQGH